MNKKQKIARGAVAAVVATGAVMLALGGGETVNLDYNIYSDNEYTSIMEIDVPKEASIDIVELYLNGEEVDKTLLPDGEFESIPMMFEDLSRLNFKLYRRGEQVGTAKFEDDKLIANIKGVEADA